MAFKNPWGQGSSNFNRWYTNKWMEGGEYYDNLSALVPKKYDHSYSTTIGTVTYTLQFNDSSPQEFVISASGQSEEEFDFYTNTDNPGRNSGWSKGSLNLFYPQTKNLLSGGARDIKKLVGMTFGTQKVLPILIGLLNDNADFRIGIIGNVRVSTGTNTEGVTVYNIAWPDPTDIKGFTLERANVTKATYFANHAHVDTLSRESVPVGGIVGLNLRDLNDDYCGVTVYLKYEKFVPQSTRQD
jgi:hypothetical protein